MTTESALYNTVHGSSTKQGLIRETARQSTAYTTHIPSTQVREEEKNTFSQGFQEGNEQTNKRQYMDLGGRISETPQYERH